MKVFGVVLLFVFVAYVNCEEASTGEWHIQTRTDLLKHRSTCVKLLEIPDAMVEEYKKWNFPNDEKTKCYLKCIFVEMKLWSEAGGFNIDHLTKQLGQGREDKDVVKAEIIKCAGPKDEGINACEWVYKGFQCFKAAHLSLIQLSVKNQE